MSTNSMRKIDQKEYLKKYLSGDKVKKKKKDKKHKKSSSSSHVKVKIIDDEVNHLDTGPKIDEELLLTGDDAPQIVGEYIEENPAESKLPKWKSIGIKEEPQNDEEDLWGKKSTDLKSKKEYFVDKQFSVKTPDSSPRRRSSPRRKHNSPSPGRKYKKNKSPHRTQRSDYTSSDNGNKIKREFITPDKSPTHRRQDRDDDYSPPRRKAPKKIRRNNSTDLTPPRNKKSYDSLSSRRGEECNLSPLRKRNNDFPDLRQSRRRRSSDQTQRKRRNHSSDQSPPRRDRESSSDQSPSIKRKNTERSQLQKSTKRPLDQSPRRRRNSDYSPLRKGRNHSPDQSPIRNIRNSDLTPSRRGRKHSLDQSPPRRRRNSDKSPHRKGKNRSPDQSPIRNIRNSDQSPSRRERLNSLDQSPTRRRRNSDQSPPRKGRNRSPDQSPIRNKRCLDQLPLRKGRKHSPDQSPPRRRRNSDQSPPRINRNSQRDAMLDSSSRSRSRTDPTKYIKREKLSPALSPPLPRRSRWERQETEKSLSPPPTHKPKPGKTLEGKTAGLQDAHALHKESLERRKQEDLLFEKMSSDISGRHAEVQVRSTGRKGRRAREALEEDPEERKRKEEHDEKKKQLYDRWGKGLKQIEDHKNRLLEQAHESSKPLARYEDDEDLERHLKEQERAEDPMLEYMRQKRKEKEKHSGKPQIPRYEGSFPENRFGIRPGYRWDGVDRSNGYEKKYFSVQNEKRARQDEAYKYSVEDM